MSGRIHDLVTAENFAKWAEERDVVPGTACHTLLCVLAQWVMSLGFSNPRFDIDGYRLDDERGPSYAVPCWMVGVMEAFDNEGETSGPALAKIARENA